MKRSTKLGKKGERVKVKGERKDETIKVKGWCNSKNKGSGIVISDWMI
ncbi:MAG TPA: hypothetical protein VGN20_27905 [Mucilaginibacter sp.]